MLTGFFRKKITIPRKLDRVHSLDLEMEWKDPNGEIQTVARNFRLLPSKNLVAIRNEDWVAVRNKIRSKVFVLDPQGNPVPGKISPLREFPQNIFLIEGA